MPLPTYMSRATARSIVSLAREGHLRPELGCALRTLYENVEYAPNGYTLFRTKTGKVAAYEHCECVESVAPAGGGNGSSLVTTRTLVYTYHVYTKPLARKFVFC